MADEHYYLGIDLGTTNSSIHWGSINPATKLVEPKEISFDQLVGDGTMQRRALLPSFLYFRPEETHPIIGEFARETGLMGQASRVARSVKSHMGQRDWRFQVDGNTYTAAQLSAMLLRTMFEGISDWLGKPVSDVIITVPASFDSDMREDTLEAARQAGFKTVEATGQARNLLLDEPRASLYDLVNLQRAGSIPTAKIDFCDYRTVLVFDLGGGTLDASLHRVRQEPGSLEIQVEDLAISRYTQLGGDVFDALIADELERRFDERNKVSLKSYPPAEWQRARNVLEAQAELAKRRLTSNIEQRKRAGVVDIPGSFSVEIQIPFVVDNKGIFTQLTKDDLTSIFAPLLGLELSLSDVNRLPEIDGAATRTVVYPILDVLWKAQKKQGQLPAVDAVILSGGMTRVHAVQDRLEQLFGVRPLTLLDPDRSVSRGAAIYHYLLHHGHRPKQILAESIGIEVQGGRVRHLVHAGTILPAKETIPNVFAVPDDNATLIRLPLYRGEGVTPEAPNKKILERQFKLTKPRPAGTPINVVVSIDENKMVRFVASFPDGEETTLETTVEGSDDAPKSNQKPNPSPTQKVPSGTKINTEWFQREWWRASRNQSVSELKGLEAKAITADNTQQVVDSLLYMLPTLNHLGKQRTFFLLGDIAQRYPEHPRKSAMIDACLKYIQPEELSYPLAVTSFGLAAVVALGEIGSDVAESHLINLLARPNVESIHDAILTSIGKCGKTINAVKHVYKYMDAADRKGDRIHALWALGRLCSREKEAPLRAKDLEKLVPRLCLKTDPKHESHATARKHAVYALGELCDRRPTLAHRDFVSEESAQQAVTALKTAEARTAMATTEEDRQLHRLAGIAIHMVRGESLTEEERGTLMAVRTLLTASGA